MRWMQKHGSELILALSSLLLVILGSGSVNASGLGNRIGNLFEESGFKVGGWINAGATFNPGNPGNGYNGPVTFADRANRFQLNQFNVFLQRTVVTEGKSWDIGGRFDFMFGTDAIYTQAFGIPSFDVNSGQPVNRGDWDLDLCCKSTRT